MGKRISKATGHPVFNRTNGTATIAPSILSADFAAMGNEIAKCRRAQTPWIHIDAMDGAFVPNITFGPPLVKSWRSAEPKVFFDVHLMIEKPMAFAQAFMEAGTELLTFHAEVSKNPKRDIKAIHEMGMKAGIAIKPGTSIQAIKDCLETADLILVMTVEPGFGGQPLIPKTLNKVRELDLIRRTHGHKYRLQVDGGINRTTAPLAVAAGADVLVAGSAVFGGGKSVAENLAALNDAMGVSATRRATKSKKSR